MRQSRKPGTGEMPGSQSHSDERPDFRGFVADASRFLGNAWVALLRHPTQLERLRGEQDLMSCAIEELLRYAGVAQTVFRRASTTFNLGGATIDRGARVVLKLSSANRDPLQFTNPDVLDFSRRLSPQFALGAGPHSCAGGLLIRMLAAIATAEFVQNVARLDAGNPIQWQRGFGSQSPKCLSVFLRQQD